MVNWPTNVNKKFYDLETTSKDNIIVTEFESGKRRVIMKNSRAKKTYKFALTLWTRAEESYFWTWYNDVLKSGAEVVELDDLLKQDGTKTGYLFTSVPSVSAGAYPRELNINVEEV